MVVLQDKLQLTEEEKEALIEELAERMKDIVYMNAWQRAEEAINAILNMDVDPSESVWIDYKFQLSINEIIEFVGRLRRRKKTKRSRVK